jgi:hypothetical protein
MKLGVSQLLSEIGLESFTGFIPCDAEAVVVEGITKRGTTSTVHFCRIVMAKVYYGRGLSSHRGGYATGRTIILDFNT